MVLGNNFFGPWDAERHDAVFFDDISGGYEATRYLLSLGNREIWFVGNSRLPWFARRMQGYSRAMEEAGLQPLHARIDSNNEPEVGYLATKSVLSQEKKLTAILTGSDSVGEGAYRALRDAGLSIPGDVSVMGFNDFEATLLHPPLTTVRVFPEQVGQHLAEVLLNRLSHPEQPPERFMIPTQIIRRESCAPRPA